MGKGNNAGIYLVWKDGMCFCLHSRDLISESALTLAFDLDQLTYFSPASYFSHQSGGNKRCGAVQCLESAQSQGENT